MFEQKLSKNFDENLIFCETYRFCNHDINKFISFLGKRVYPCEYMVDWEKRNEISLHEKQDFYSHIRFEGITNVNYIYAKKICKDFET